MTVTDDTIHEQIEAFKAQTESKQYSDLLDQYSSKEASTGRWTPVTKSAWAPRKAATVRAKEIMKRAQHTAVANQKITQAEQVAIGAGSPVVAKESNRVKVASTSRVAILGLGGLTHAPGETFGQAVKSRTKRMAQNAVFGPGEAARRRQMMHSRPSPSTVTASETGVKISSRIRVAEVLKNPTPEGQEYYKRLMRHRSEMSKKSSDDGVKTASRIRVAEVAPQDEAPTKKKMSLAKKVAIGGAALGGTALALRSGAPQAAVKAYQVAKKGTAVKGAVGTTEALSKGFAAGKKRLGRAVFGRKRIVTEAGGMLPISKKPTLGPMRQVGNKLESVAPGAGATVKRVRAGDIRARRQLSLEHRQFQRGKKTLNQVSPGTQAAIATGARPVRKTTGDKALNAAMWGSMVPAFMPQHGGNG